MNADSHPRLSALSGLAIAAAVALWWLGSTRLALDQGSDPGRASAQALLALWLVRAACLALVCTRVAAVGGARAGAQATLGLVAPAWPLVTLAWSGSALPLLQTGAMEVSLLALGAALSLAGHGIGRFFKNAGHAVLVASVLGAALAVCMWFALGLWPTPLR
jgi:hypothetical protein